jgi:hypothetical protein
MTERARHTYDRSTASSCLPGRRYLLLAGCGGFLLCSLASWLKTFFAKRQEAAGTYQSIDTIRRCAHMHQMRS